MQKIIWSNMDLDIEDFKEFFEENNIKDEDEKYQSMYDLNNNYLYDERINLNCYNNNKIIAIADIGLWNGRRQGYKEYNKLSDILYSDCDYVKWYADKYNIRAKMYHHDGTNYMLYREYKDGLTDTQIQNFKDKIYNGEEITTNILNYYTKSLRKSVANIYGW